MLRDLNVSNAGKRDSTDPRVGVLASEIPTGFPLPAFLLNDIDAGFPNRLYSLEILTLPSAGTLYLDKRGVGTFTGAPDGTYTGTQRVRKYDPGVGLASTADTTYTLTVGAAATAPAAPTGVTATAGNGTVSVTGAPGSNGGSAVTSWQVVASTGQTATGNTLPVSIAMPNGVAATFQLRAINAIGPGPLSAASSSVTPTAPVSATAPAAPTAVVATAGNGSVSVTGTAGATGGSPITGWAVVASTGQTASSATLPVTIAMPNGVAATFQLRAINAVGPGALSAASNAVTPSGQVTPPTPTVTSVTLLPATATLAGGATLQLNATAAGVTPPQTFNWTREPALGSVSSAGLVTAPMATSAEQVYVVTATSTLNPDAKDTCVITVPAMVVSEPGVKRTVNVTVLALDQQGNRMGGADVTAVLDKADIDDEAGYIAPEQFTGTTDDTGTLVLALWPNELGTLGSRYKFKIVNPDTGKPLRVMASIPNTDCFLHRVAEIPEQ